MSFTARFSGAATAAVLLTASLAAPTAATAAPVPATAATSDVTSQLEQQRVDSVPAPVLAWYNCGGKAQCATAALPLDYDDPAGPAVQIAVTRLKARKPAARIGSLFVNPGGPGGSGTEMAADAANFLSDSVLDRFDIVGFDPRGVGASTELTCFTSTRSQTIALAKMSVAFPYGQTEQAAYIKSAQTVGKACSTTGAALAGAMSTAEAARDMDVLRRAVGDPKLTYLGFSYGSALGQYYANMFPDRVRALAIDGVINPVSWTGTAATGSRLQDDRLRSADGAYRALQKLLERCDTVGSKRCSFAAGNPSTHFATIARRLRAEPLVLGRDPDAGTVRLTYASFVGLVLSALYSPYAADAVTSLAGEVAALQSGTATGTAPRATARRSLLQRVVRQQAAARDFAYDNSLEAFAGVMCTDGAHPADAAKWPGLTAAADKRAPYFGRAWGWSSVPCATDTWTVHDEDAYTGPFNRRTSAPVLVVGNYWDPATNYREAVSSAKLLPNSRLLTSDNWGHTAYGTSACVTRAMDTYLLRGALPAAGTLCRSEIQPFSTKNFFAAEAGKTLPPVTGPYGQPRESR
ncbi:alpha/beta hydrolase [Actinoplanes sp. N902-109]|uniref:alpha/beta hydrolase n=1 Tax=Actinoplanes sp. (strain N902-109) TaxID=649831 RepID=UPI0003293FAA|nr:alpha/beta hydrolase [Actinoplanes sp. N902-109]AGL16870.1 tap domain-containing protein [Actinoplanes sp. N902-109]